MTPGLRFRLTIDGEVVEDVLIEDPDDAPGFAARHAEACRLADDRGQAWLLEITDPDGDMDPLRQTNDPALLKNPIPATDVNLAAERDLRVQQLRHPRRDR